MFEEVARNASPKARPFDVKEVGIVREVKGTIARIVGLPSCIGGQLVTFSSEVQGMVVGFEPEEVEVMVLGEAQQIKVGERVYGRAEPFRIPVGPQFVGRLVNSLAEPIDGRGTVPAETLYPLFRKAPGIMERVPITKPLETGIKILDTMIPIGKGQRELILGDRMSGKTALALDAILNQKGKGTVCVYCCIGRSFHTLRKVAQLLEASGALSYTFVVVETAAAPAGRQFLTPYAATTLGEYFMDRGKDVLVVFDDLTKHAWIHRQISLLLGRPPGREAYPGDMFYVHSQLMERAAALNPERGGGSMTFLPLVETQQGDVTRHIPSNTISMTDGQIYLSTALFTEGFKPAIDLKLSVSRIGSKVQSSAMREVAGQLRLDYLQFKEMERVTKLRTSFSKDLTERMKKGAILRELLIQDKSQPVSMEETIVLLYGYHSGALLDHSPAEVRRLKKDFFTFLKSRRQDLAEALKVNQTLTDRIKSGLNQEYAEFFKCLPQPN